MFTFFLFLFSAVVRPSLLALRRKDKRGRDSTLSARIISSALMANLAGKYSGDRQQGNPTKSETLGYRNSLNSEKNQSSFEEQLLCIIEIKLWPQIEAHNKKQTANSEKIFKPEPPEELPRGPLAFPRSRGLDLTRRSPFEVGSYRGKCS